MPLRFTDTAALRMREAIREAGWVEVFAIGDVEGGKITGVTVACRGTTDAVPALLERPRTGQVVIHNHPSGDLRPSEADMSLAGRYGDAGVGMVIVDSHVTRDNWVVEPHKVRHRAVSNAEVEAFFRGPLRAALPGFEPREPQLAMAAQVAASLSEQHPYVVEAGTGTGKSLAYLVPAALWAIANDSKVVVSTHTKALQHQLATADLPLLTRAGLDLRFAVLQGRNNYLCKRRLGLALDETDAEAEERPDLEALAAWDRTTEDGSRGQSGFTIPGELWERVESDSDLTLRTKCQHYAGCHYYSARRKAAGAHIVVVNHALLLADLALRDEADMGLLPTYHRLVLDEAHHLEAAATGAVSARTGLRALQRAISPLQSRGRRQGALERLALSERSAEREKLPEADLIRLDRAIENATEAASGLQNRAPLLLETLASEALEPTERAKRITDPLRESPLWMETLEPRLEGLVRELDAAVGALGGVLSVFEDKDLPEARLAPVAEVRRAARRLGAHATTVRDLLEGDADRCAWIEARSDRHGVRAELAHAPIEVGPVLRRILWDKLPGTSAASATLTVAGRFTHWQVRVGQPEAEQDVLPSPFDHANQALLALPRDLPLPEAPDFLAATAAVVVEAVRASRGGAFVLCTSYDAVDAYARAVREAFPRGRLLVQDRTGRAGLVEQFRDARDAVLIGTDSFWEGVDVRGDALRLVIIPRLPFRVPTDPLTEARYERAKARGLDPFQAFSLPEAIIKLKQGYGRLIRSRSDRGVVLMLDRRLHDRPYGRIMLSSLPPARRVVGPWRRVSEELRGWFGG